MTAGTFRHSATSPHWSVVTGVVVAVPTIADAETDEVAVDVSGSGFDFTLNFGDFVIVNEEAALPTSCQSGGARITAEDEITFGYGAFEGGSGVTGANVNYSIMAAERG